MQWMSPSVYPWSATAFAACKSSQDLPIFGLPARSVSHSTKYPRTTYLIGSNRMAFNSVALTRGAGAVDPGPLGLGRAFLPSPTPAFANSSSAICSGVFCKGFAPDGDEHRDLVGGPRRRDRPLQPHCNVAQLFIA